jgi:diguanylate cyclase (GGDEF)-like protein/PAS domain S-box-containing protein
MIGQTRLKRQGISIRLRLLAMMMAVVSVAALGGYGVFAYWQIGAQQARLGAFAQSLTEVLSQDFARMVLLNDPAVAADVSARLAAFPVVRLAVLYDAAAEPLFEYRENGIEIVAPPLASIDRPRSDGDGMHLRQTVSYVGQEVGTLYINMESESFAALLRRDMVSLLQVGALSLLLSLVLAMRFERRFNAPVLRLVEFLEHADAEATLERRVNPDGSNEYARLYRAVNGMLDRIQTAQAKLRQAASVFEYANEGIVITTAAGEIVEVNSAFTRITLYAREEALGKNPRMLQSGRHGSEFFAAMWQALRSRGHWSGEIWNRRKNGEVYPELLTISAIKGEKGDPQGYVALFYDISQIKEQQRQLEHLAHFDALTTLPNRTLLADRMQQAMRQGERRRSQVAAVFLDVDSFKTINDTYGHAIGDKLLVALAGRLLECLREGDTLARLGGDEFVVVLCDLHETAAAIPIVDRLLQAAAAPLSVDSLLLSASVSIGVSFYPQAENVDADQLLRQADQAMYIAKQSGKNRYHLFDAEQDRLLRGRHESIERIRTALENGELALFYQPKVSLRSGAVVGFEALMRWHDPERGLIPPGQFLPLIENHDLNIALGDWVIENALLQMEAWHAHGHALPVSVNIAGRQLQAPEFFNKLKAALSLHPAVSNQLELEVLESSALDDMIHVAQIMERCKEAGAGFALDDFGAGYASLTYLKRLPAQTLKIDQGFVREMLESPDDLAILQGIVVLAESFGRSIVAEGVETSSHSEMLLRLGCDLAQGFAIARPMPADAVIDWLDHWKPEGMWHKPARAERGEMPMLQAMAEIGAWVATLRRHLHDAAVPPPPLDHVGCRFAAWLSKVNTLLLANAEAKSRIQGLHQEMHRCAAELVKLANTGRRVEAGNRFGEIESRRDALINAVQGLLDTARSLHA